MIPVDDPDLREQILEILELFFLDNTHAHAMQADGSYIRVKPGKGDEPMQVQHAIYRMLRKQQKSVPMYEKEFPVRRKPG